MYFEFSTFTFTSFKFSLLPLPTAPRWHQSNVRAQCSQMRHGPCPHGTHSPKGKEELTHPQKLLLAQTGKYPLIILKPSPSGQDQVRLKVVPFVGTPQQVYLERIGKIYLACLIAGFSGSKAIITSPWLTIHFLHWPKLPIIQTVFKDYMDH